MHKSWDLRHWRHCVFSDEPRFTLFHSDDHARVRNRYGNRLKDAFIQLKDGKRGPTVMVWGAIHRRGWSKMVVPDGTLNRQRYTRPLRDSMLLWATGVFGRNFLYVQNNATPHTTRSMTVFQAQQDVEVMGWPARSPVMNPIEHVWDQMGVWIRDMDVSSSTVPELQRAVLRAIWFFFHDAIIWMSCCSTVELP